MEIKKVNEMIGSDTKYIHINRVHSMTQNDLDRFKRKNIGSLYHVNKKFEVKKLNTGNVYSLKTSYLNDTNDYFPYFFIIDSDKKLDIVIKAVKNHGELVENFQEELMLRAKQIIGSL